MLPVTTQSTPLGYQPGLDGLRGVFVIAVLLFHGGFGWAIGGYLGVSGFFTLSGFLICSLLLDERFSNGKIDLIRFWKRRARRLLPAAWLALAGALVYGAVAAPPAVQRDVPGDVIAALAYVANWRFIINETSYEALFSEPSPVTHLWSLAIEEQYYLIFPLMVVGLLALAGGRRTALAIGLGVLAVASTAWMYHLYTSTGDTTRAYYGTDTRAAEMLIGAGAALVWKRWLSQPLTGRGGRMAEQALQVGGAAALIGVAVLWTQVPVSAGWLYQGGFAVHSVAIVLVLFAAARPGPMRGITAFEPLRQLGLISYGVYLFHWPIFLWLSPTRTGLDGWALFVLRIAVTLGVSIVSYLVIERPIRAGVRLRGRVALITAPVTAVLLVAGALAMPTTPPTMLESAAFGTELDPFDEFDIELERARQRDTPEPDPPPTTAAPDEDEDDGPVVDAEPEPAEPPSPRWPPPMVSVYGDSTAFGPLYGLIDVDITTGRVHMVPGRIVMGCGLVRAPALRQAGVVYPLSQTCASWPEEWVALLDQHQPDIAVLMYGPWDASDRRLADGRWVSLGDPAYDALVASEIRTALELLTSRVDLVVWLTAPPIDQSMNQLGGGPWPASEPGRLSRWNELVAVEIDRYPDSVATTVDLRGWFEALPGGPFDPAIRPDGVHIADEQAPIVGHWLAEEILDRWHARMELEDDQREAMDALLRES